MENETRTFEPRILMPENANIPKEWCIHIDDKKTIVVVPSRSLKGGIYHVTMMHDTRELLCNCEGFKFRNHCHHTAGLIWFCYKKARSKGVQDISIASYHAFTEQELGERQLAVYRELLKGNASSKELGRALNWPSNCLTPRVKELRERGVVIEAGRQYDEKTKRWETVWMALKGWDGL